MAEQTNAGNPDLTFIPVAQRSNALVVHGANGYDTLAGNDPSRPNAIEAFKEALIETDFAELGDGTQIELIEDPEDSSRTLLAVFKDGEVNLTDRFKHGDRIFVPIPRSGNLIRHVRLPRGIERYESKRSILNQAASILSRCLDLEQNDIRLLAQFAVSTWFIERLPVAPYIASVRTQAG